MGMFLQKYASISIEGSYERREFTFLGVHLIVRTIGPRTVGHDTFFMAINHHRIWSTGVRFRWCVNGTFWFGDAISLLMDGKPPRDRRMEGEGEFLPLQHSFDIGVVTGFAGLISREIISGRLC